MLIDRHLVPEISNVVLGGGGQTPARQLKLEAIVSPEVNRPELDVLRRREEVTGIDRLLSCLDWK